MRGAVTSQSVVANLYQNPYLYDTPQPKVSQNVNSILIMGMVFQKRRFMGQTSKPNIAQPYLAVSEH